MTDGYCDGGEHYIGEADECERCEEYEKMVAEERSTKKDD